jgi:hypothetical protein
MLVIVGCGKEAQGLLELDKLEFAASLGDARLAIVAA